MHCCTESPQRDERKDNENNNNNIKEETQTPTKGNDTGNGKKELKLKRTEATSLMQDIFGGQVVSEVECCECGNRSTTKEIIYDLSVEIPKQEQIEKAVKERKAQPLPQQSWVSSFLGFVGLSKQSV